MTEKEIVMREIDDLPARFLREVLDFVRFLKSKAAREAFETALLSETSLRKDWLSPEEDEAWEDL